MIRIRLTAIPLPTDQSRALREQATGLKDRTQREALLASAQQMEARGMREIDLSAFPHTGSQGGIVSLAVANSATVQMAKAPDLETLQEWRQRGLRIDVETCYTVHLPKDANQPHLFLGPVQLKRGGEPQRLWLQDHDYRECKRLGVRFEEVVATLYRVTLPEEDGSTNTVTLWFSAQERREAEKAGATVEKVVAAPPAGDPPPADDPPPPKTAGKKKQPEKKEETP